MHADQSNQYYNFCSADTIWAIWSVCYFSKNSWNGLGTLSVLPVVEISSLQYSSAMSQISTLCLSYNLSLPIWAVIRTAVHSTARLLSEHPQLLAYLWLDCWMWKHKFTTTSHALQWHKPYWSTSLLGEIPGPNVAIHCGISVASFLESDKALTIATAAPPITSLIDLWCILFGVCVEP